MKHTKKFLPVILAVIAVAGVSFYGGMVYGQSKGSATSRTRFQQAANAIGQRDARVGGGFTAGQVISKDDKSITVKLNNGGSSIIFFTNATPILKSASGSSQDLTIGEQITVMGTSNQDGSLNAQSIQIRPPQPVKQ